MSDPAEQLEDGEDNRADNEGQVQEKPKVATGYQTKEQWIENGHNPDDYVSEEVFNDRGKQIKINTGLRRQLETAQGQINTLSDRAKQQDAMQRIGLETQRDNLLAQRSEAVDQADNDAVNKIQGSIDNINKTLDKPEVEDTPEQGQLEEATAQWIEDNPWVNSNTPRGAWANSVLKQCIEHGYSQAETIAAVEAEDKRQFPKTNKRASTPRVSEGGSAPGNKQKAKDVSYSDLNADEQRYCVGNISSICPGTETIKIGSKTIYNVDKKNAQAFVKKLRADS